MSPSTHSTAALTVLIEKLKLCCSAVNWALRMVPEDEFLWDMQDHHRCAMVVLLVNTHDGSALSAGLTCAAFLHHTVFLLG